MNMPGFTAASSLIQTTSSLYSTKHYALTDGAIYPASCDDACYTDCHSICTPDCSDFIGNARGACLRGCAKDCRKGCGCGR
jgi:hypothetical protein